MFLKVTYKKNMLIHLKYYNVKSFVFILYFFCFQSQGEQRCRHRELSLPERRSVANETSQVVPHI